MLLSIIIYSCSRNCATGESFTGTNQVLLTLKVILDCASRTVIFSAWLYVTNDGQFSSLRTLTAFYLTLLVLIVFNATCNTTKHYWSPRTWIGIFFYLFMKRCIFLLSGIILNSYSSVLSYNNFNIKLMLVGKRDDYVWHESTFLRQFVYFILIFSMNIG